MRLSSSKAFESTAAKGDGSEPSDPTLVAWKSLTSQESADTSVERRFNRQLHQLLQHAVGGGVEANDARLEQDAERCSDEDVDES